MLGFQGPAQPSPALGDALNAGYRYLEVKCLGCNTHQTVALDMVRRPKTTPVHELERYMRCKDVRRCAAIRTSAPPCGVASDQDHGERSARDVVAERVVNSDQRVATRWMERGPSRWSRGTDPSPSDGATAGGGTPPQNLCTTGRIVRQGYPGPLELIPHPAEGMVLPVFDLDPAIRSSAPRPPSREAPQMAWTRWVTARAHSEWAFLRSQGDATPERGVCPDILCWAATNRSAAGSSHGDQQVFDTDGVFFDKAELPETMVAGATLRLGKPTADGLRSGSGHLARLRLLGRLAVAALRRPTDADPLPRRALACLSHHRLIMAQKPKTGPFGSR